MFYHDGGKLQYHVSVDTPDPMFAKALQQAIGGVQGEIRVALQYLFQAWGSRGPAKYRDLLLQTGTEELGHIEMLATAVALNLEGAPLEQEEAAKDPMMEAILGGMNPQHVLSSAMAAMPIDASGVPFNCSHVYASGNAAADMLANVFAESTGRMLAVQLFKMTDDQGMKDMLRFLIARDSMHQNQWLAAWEELGGRENHPIPNNFPMDEELAEYSYAYLTTSKDQSYEEGSWTKGATPDGRGEFVTQPLEPIGGVAHLGPADERAPVQAGQMGDHPPSEQLEGGPAQNGKSAGKSAGKPAGKSTGKTNGNPGGHPAGKATAKPGGRSSGGRTTIGEYIRGSESTINDTIR